MSDSDDATTYRGPEIPKPLGEQLQVALALDERPRTFGDWVDAMAFIADRGGIDVDLDTLCTTDDSPHRATFAGDTQHYQCAQDAFIVPFLADGVDTVEIETESPVSGETIRITVTESTIDVAPSSSILSFGVATDVEESEENETSPMLAYERICPYGYAFVSRSEYEEWATDTEALTMPVTVEETLELARALGRVA